MAIDDSKTEQPTDLQFRPLTGGPPSAHLISGATITRAGNHDVVKIWNRGGLAGELTVTAGDGAALVHRLGLAPRMA